ncbi:LysR family transcriptional regulator [Silvimonas sp.]|uniref:LysR family transcriptional regulator n=1 Tax=Silvimonas sp. TaxID=2650811 RepID=UPI0028501DE0|nr:LysR family transcriptional regulator [Silvimonas sp.]MDR3427511.1 LysR family transcriptional regulator [Silvimonas sp.]
MASTGFSELNAFVAVAEHRSFRAAARALDVSASALSHAIRGLEERLGVRLFNRTTRSVALTDAGEQFLLRVRPAIADIEDAISEARSARDKPSGSLRISTSESGATPLIRHVLPEFLATYPDIHIEFVLDNRMLDIVAGEFDAGIRLLETVPRDMIAVKFGRDMRFTAVATPAYLAQHRTPTTPQDLLQHRCIRFRFDSGQLYRWDPQYRGRTMHLDVNGPLTVGNLKLAIEGALAGIGIAWVPEDDVAEHLAAGRLTAVLPDWSPAFPGLCLYYPANRHPPTALRLFAEAIRGWAQGRESAGAQ